MTEVWKSNPRKFCEYCKCWTADNKISIEFHERGKKHLENVRIRLDEIAKRGTENFKNKQLENDYMKEMEQAALRAYKKDLEQNPDLTGTKLTSMAKEKNLDIVVGATGKSDKKVSDAKVQEKSEEHKVQSANRVVKKWFEAKSPEGYSYFWNKETSESIWEVPTEGFVSLKEQEAQKEKKKEVEVKKDAQKEKDVEVKKDDCSDTKHDSNTEKIRKKKHKHKGKDKDSFKIINNLNQKNGSTAKEVFEGPIFKAQPYGTWSTVREEPQIDLQLPDLPTNEYQPVVYKKGRITFEEKTVSLEPSKSVGEGSGISFKKRKIGDTRSFMERRDL